MLRDTLETPTAAACAGIGLKTESSASALQHTVGSLTSTLHRCVQRQRCGWDCPAGGSSQQKQWSHLCGKHFVAMFKHYAIILTMAYYGIDLLGSWLFMSCSASLCHWTLSWTAAVVLQLAQRLTCATSCLAWAMSASDRILFNGRGLGGSSSSLKAGGLGVLGAAATVMRASRWL